MALTIEQVAYGGWDRCVRVSNGTVDLVITAEVGPRIIRYGFVDGPNMFCEVPETMGKTGGDEWRIYGGHRFWHAPEQDPRSYQPDNEPVEIREHGGVVFVHQKTEPATGLQKSLMILMAKQGSQVTVQHQLTNNNLWAVEASPWALSVMAAGGTCIFPFPPRGSHAENLLPANSLTMWAYTNMADPRWTWGARYIMLKQEPGNEVPQKVGASVPDGWAAYVNDGNAFITRFDLDPTAAYPGSGSNFETFTNEFMLEVETLGALAKIKPGDSAEHTEVWSLHADIPAITSENDIDQYIKPLVD